MDLEDREVGVASKHQLQVVCGTGSNPISSDIPGQTILAEGRVPTFPWKTTRYLAEKRYTVNKCEIDYLN